MINCKLYLTTCSFCIICCRSKVFHHCFKCSSKLLVYGTIMRTILLHNVVRRVNTFYLNILYCISIHFNRVKTQPFLKLNQSFTRHTIVSYETKTIRWESKNIASSWLSGQVLRKLDMFLFWQSLTALQNDWVYFLYL